MVARFNCATKRGPVHEPSFNGYQPCLGGDENTKGNLDRRGAPVKFLVDRMNEQRPSVLQVGDHHHAEDAADELAPTFRIGFCGSLDYRRAGGPHGHAARMIREIERHFIGTHFCSRFPVSTSPV